MGLRARRSSTPRTVAQVSCRPKGSVNFRFVAVVAVLAALALCVPVQAQTPEIDALRVRAEAGDASAQSVLGFRYANGEGVPQDYAEAVRWYPGRCLPAHRTRGVLLRIGDPRRPV